MFIPCYSLHIYVYTLYVNVYILRVFVWKCTHSKWHVLVYVYTYICLRYQVWGGADKQQWRNGRPLTRNPRVESSIAIVDPSLALPSLWDLYNSYIRLYPSMSSHVSFMQMQPNCCCFESLLLILSLNFWIPIIVLLPKDDDHRCLSLFDLMLCIVASQLILPSLFNDFHKCLFLVVSRSPLPSSLVTCSTSWLSSWRTLCAPRWSTPRERRTWGLWAWWWGPQRWWGEAGDGWAICKMNSKQQQWMNSAGIIATKMNFPLISG